MNKNIEDHMKDNKKCRKIRGYIGVQSEQISKNKSNSLKLKLIIWSKI